MVMGEIKKEVWFVSAVLIVISVVITFSTPKSPIERSSKDENGEEWLKIIEDQLKANIDDGWKKIENGSLPNRVGKDLEKWEGYLRDIGDGKAEITNIEKRTDGKIEMELYIPAKKVHLYFTIDSKNNTLYRWKSSEEVETMITVIYENSHSDDKNLDMKLKPIKLDLSTT